MAEDVARTELASDGYVLQKWTFLATGPPRTGAGWELRVLHLEESHPSVIVLSDLSKACNM